MKKSEIGVCVLMALTSMFLFSACKVHSDTPLWKVILLIVGIIAIMIIANSILEFLAVKIAYIYWPICLILTLVFFFKELKGSNLGSDLGIFYAHGILLYLLIPNMDDSIHNYLEISYKYDFTFEEWRETDRKTITEETPGFIIKLIVIAVLLVVFFFMPGWIFKDDREYKMMLYLPLAVEGLISGIFSILGITRLIKYHG